MTFNYTLSSKGAVEFNCLVNFQTGPSKGTDKVKKGGSFMCHKVLVFTSFDYFQALHIYYTQ